MGNRTYVLPLTNTGVPYCQAKPAHVRGLLVSDHLNRLPLVIGQQLQKAALNVHHKLCQVFIILNLVWCEREVKVGHLTQDVIVAREDRLTHRHRYVGSEVAV